MDRFVNGSPDNPSAASAVSGMTRDIGAASGEAARAALLKTATASGTHVARKTSGEPLTPAADRAIWHLNRFFKKRARQDSNPRPAA